jgi:hypothetical protein
VAGNAEHHYTRNEEIMGLDTTHGCWSGSYSGFSQWRSNIAKAAGYPPADGLTGYELPWDKIKDENYQGDWSEPPPDDLWYLLAHSDCDGVIHSDHAALLTKRLEEVVPLLPDELDRELGQQFIDGLREAAMAGEDVDFSLAEL